MPKALGVDCHVELPIVYYKFMTTSVKPGAAVQKDSAWFPYQDRPLPTNIACTPPPCYKHVPEPDHYVDRLQQAEPCLTLNHQGEQAPDHAQQHQPQVRALKAPYVLGERRHRKSIQRQQGVQVDQDQYEENAETPCHDRGRGLIPMPRLEPLLRERERDRDRVCV